MLLARAWQGKREARRRAAANLKPASFTTTPPPHPGASQDDAAGNAGQATKRVRAGDIYALVADSGVQTTLELLSLAHSRAAGGDAALAQFCTRVGPQRLSELLGNARAVTEAPRALAASAASRLDLLRQAAVELECTCSGAWLPGARRVLENNGEDVAAFCRDVCRALELGARRGTNLAIVGVPGCGKSTIFDSLDCIFKVMGKPERGSSFPLAGMMDAHILVWQDYCHHDSTMLFEDILSLSVGESIEIRVPHSRNVRHRNTAPMFYTSQQELRVQRRDAALSEQLNAAMAERFCTRIWQMPLPLSERLPNFPRCGRCCAAFFLLNR